MPEECALRLTCTQYLIYNVYSYCAYACIHDNYVRNYAYVLFITVQEDGDPLQQPLE